MIGHTTLRSTLPGQTFYSTQIHDCLWLLAKMKNADTYRRHQTNAALFKA